MANYNSADAAYYTSDGQPINGKDYFHEYLCCWMSALMQAKGYGIEAKNNEAKYYQQVSVIREHDDSPDSGAAGWTSRRNSSGSRMPIDRYGSLGEFPIMERRPTMPPRQGESLLSRQGQEQREQSIEFPRKRVHGPYTCEDCGKVLKRSSSLSNHRLIHKNVKAFRCDKCGARFLRKSDLGKHYAIHTGSKPYVCNICDKSFSQSSNMLTHKRRHTGVKPFKCDYCSKSFYRKVDVKRHEIVHNICGGE